MKTLLAALVLLAATQVYAEVKPIGTVVPYLCAQKVTSKKAGVNAVCFASKSRMKGSYLVIRTDAAHGSQRLVLPIQEVRPGNSGITGTLKSFIMTVLVQGDIAVDLHGMGDSINPEVLYGNLLGRFDFSANDFQFVATTASL